MDKVNYILYYPEYGSKDQIEIQGDPQSEQEVILGLKDVSWMDYKDRKFGTLTSNEKRIYIGTVEDKIKLFRWKSKKKKFQFLMNLEQILIKKLL